MSNIHVQRKPIIVIPPSPRTMPRRAKPPRVKKERGYRGPRLLAPVLLLLIVIAIAHLLIVTHQPTAPAVTLSTNCADFIRATDYTQSVKLQSNTEQMSAVEFVSQLDGGQPAALVQVTHNATPPTLDVYIFGCALQAQKPHMTTLFTGRGLQQGTVEISSAGTLMTGALDTTITPDASAFLLPLQQNIYREYAWQNGAFKQVAFPALYPVESRVEAEALQKNADSGQTLPWNDPLATAEELSRDIFKWPAVDARNTVSSNNGITAQVELFQAKPHLLVDVTLQRLLQHDNKGLWFVVSAHSAGITLGLGGQPRTTLPQDITTQTPLTAPIHLSGTSVLADGATSSTLFDHTLSPISNATGITLKVNANGTYTGSLAYSGIIADQQGLLLIQSLPAAANNQVESGQLLLVPVLLG